MEYNFREIEQKWRQKWKDTQAYTVSNESDKPKYYVLDMFPYPSGAGLHVGHPLGYIASDIFARYKRLKGFNVLHPMGYDAFGLPAEQYAIDHGIHPAVSTEDNINNFRKQLDNIGFCYDWNREVRTCDPKYYKWTQWIFLQLFKSWYNRQADKAEPIEKLVVIFEKEGNINNPVPNSKFELPGGSGQVFTAEQWIAFDEFTQQSVLMEYRLAYCGYGEVNWCEALGTVLANDEVINGVSERGGHPVVKKKLRQWYLRITEYADRLQRDLETLEWSDAMKEMQTNWIGKSSGAEITFSLASPPAPLPGERGGAAPHGGKKSNKTADNNWHILKEFGRENRKNPTPAEDLLWQHIRNNKLGLKVRRQHTIRGYIVDFAILEASLVVELDGEYHNEEQQRRYDEARTDFLGELGLTLIRFSNEEVLQNVDVVIEKIKTAIQGQKQNSVTAAGLPLLPWEKGPGDETVRVYTTRPDTIFGVDFMVLAPEHELVKQITTAGRKATVDEYVDYVKSRSERERMAEKKISGCFTGAYAVHPFTGNNIPIWISEYVLAGYGTGAIMAVPAGDERDHKFAQYFGIPITNIFGDVYTGEEAIADKNVTIQNSGFISGLPVKEAAEKVITELEENGDGVRKTNYKMRDAAFSRQRYWGEPFPIVWKDGIAYPLDESQLPLELPHIEEIKPGKDGEGPLANLKEWALIPSPSPSRPAGEKGAIGAANVPKYTVRTPVQYELAKQMRKDYTEAEGKLWELLRGNKLGAKFRRQHPIDAYIADFVSLQDKLIVEVDGGYHETVEQKEYDEQRTKVLNEIGFRVVRYSNKEVLDDPYAVRDKIKNELKNQHSSSHPETSNEPEPELPSPPVERGQGVREASTMPGYAGSSWYFLRYMDPHNDAIFCDRKASDYWNQVDLYIGGTEHAVGHLLYSRMWTKALYDLGYIGFFEPFKKLVNQGMIQGSSRFVYRVRGTNTFVSFGLKDQYETDEIHVDVNIVDGVDLDIDSFKKWRAEFENAEFVLEDGKYVCGTLTEKMSKRLFNTVNPDDLVNKYGADTFRMYEMFLGPVEQSKPWDAKGIEGVHRFLKKLWRLFYDENGPIWTGGEATAAELKILHQTIKKIEDDTERFSFNTGVSAFMIAVNELTELQCHKKEILENMLVLLTPYAPHIAEELWHQLGNTGSILDASYPKFEERHVLETSKTYPVAINGKTRTELNLPLDITQEEVEKLVQENEVVLKWLEGKPPRKVIYVKNRMINVVV